MPAAPARRPASATKERDLSRPLPASLSWTALIAFAAAFAIAYVAFGLPWWLPAVYAAMSVVTFAAYAVDKLAAPRGWSRVPERTLLSLGLLCGWPGALVAQQLLRHKTRKRAFRGPFWRTVVLNVLLLAAVVAASATGTIVLT